MTGGERSPQIETLIEEFQRSGMRELHVRTDDFEIYLSSDSEAERIVKTAGADAERPHSRKARGTTDPATKKLLHAAAADRTAPEGSLIVAAPYLGTFYRAPKPGAAVFVELGDRIEPDTELCLVEVMKLFTAVRAEMSGTIVAVLADDGAMVQAGQPLFAIEAS